MVFITNQARRCPICLVAKHFSTPPRRQNFFEIIFFKSTRGGGYGGIYHCTGLLACVDL